MRFIGSYWSLIFFNMQLNMDEISIDLESNNLEDEVSIDLEDDTIEKGWGISIDHKMCKRRLTSQVWYTFNMLSKGADGKQICKYKDYGSIYLCESKYGFTTSYIKSFQKKYSKYRSINNISR